MWTRLASNAHISSCLCLPNVSAMIKGLCLHSQCLWSQISLWSYSVCTPRVDAQPVQHEPVFTSQAQWARREEIQTTESVPWVYPSDTGEKASFFDSEHMHMALEADAIHPSFLGGNPSQLLIQIPFKKYFLGSVRWLSGQKCSPHKLDNLSLIPRIHVNVEKTNWFYKIVLWLPHAGHGAHMCTHIYTVIIYKCKQGWIDSSVVKSIY